VNPVRPTPYALAFGDLAETRFPLLRDALAAAGVAPRDRDAFLLVREVAELIRELVPEGGLGEEVEGLAALVHTAYLFWLDGTAVRQVSEPELARTLQAPEAEKPPGSPAAEVRYVQLPSLRVWGRPIEDHRAEPLDGWFRRGVDDRLLVLAVFGLHPHRDGFTVVEVEGPRAHSPTRADGSPLFAPTLDGGIAAGLASVAGAEELLDLAWRAEVDG
jgi:hypothetical protein